MPLSLTSSVSSSKIIIAINIKRGPTSYRQTRFNVSRSDIEYCVIFVRCNGRPLSTIHFQMWPTPTQTESMKNRIIDLPFWWAILVILKQWTTWCYNRWNNQRVPVSVFARPWSALRYLWSPGKPRSFSKRCIWQYLFIFLSITGHVLLLL